MDSRPRSKSFTAGHVPPPKQLLPTIAFSKEFLRKLKMDEKTAYGLRPVFAARCERYTTTNRYVERAVVVTQDGQLLLFDMTDKVRRITNTVELGKNRPHKKLILQVDRVAEPDDGKQSVRLFTEPLSPLADTEKPQWNRWDMRETEEEFEQRMRAEAAARGEFLPDLDLVLVFHCKRAPVALQFVSILRNFIAGEKDCYFEVEDTPILDQVFSERPFVDVIKNIFRPKKPTRTAPVPLQSVATSKLSEIEAGGATVKVPPPVQPPRQGGKGKDEAAVEEYKFGVTPRLVENLKKKQRREKLRQRAASGGADIPDDATSVAGDSDSSEHLVDHLPQYKFDDRDPEDVERERLYKLNRPQRKPLEELSAQEEEEGSSENDDDSDAEAKRRMLDGRVKVKHTESKIDRKARDKAAKKRLAEEEDRNKARSRLLLKLSIDRHIADRHAAGYRYGTDFTDELSNPTPPPMYRSKKKKKDSPMFFLRAPSDEESLALTSLCFYRRNAVATPSPLTDPEAHESVSLAIAAAGQLILCRARPAEQGELEGEEHDEGDDNETRVVPMDRIVRCVVDFSNHYVNGVRSGFITLVVDVSSKEDRKKRKERQKEREARQEHQDDDNNEDGEEDGASNADGSRGSNDGTRDDDDDDGRGSLRSSAANSSVYQDERRRGGKKGRRSKKSKQKEDAAAAFGENDDDLIDLRIVEIELDDVAGGEVNPDDVECCELEYFVKLVETFSPTAVVEVNEPPFVPPADPAQPLSGGNGFGEDGDGEDANIPSGAAKAARLVTAAANRAKAFASSTGDFSAPIYPVDETTHRTLLRKLTTMSAVVADNPNFSPNSIKKRGDELRRVIEEYRVQNRSSSAAVGNDSAYEASTMNFERSRTTGRDGVGSSAATVEENRRHRALTQLIYDITQRRLAARGSVRKASLYDSVLHGSPLLRRSESSGRSQTRGDE